jgi:hypothetical protein
LEVEKLDIPRCREILGTWGAGLPDEEVELLRDRLYVLTALLFEAAFRAGSKDKGENGCDSADE